MISRGETKFCEGCPLTGYFVGSVLPQCIKKEYTRRLIFTDNDGMDSAPIEARLGEAFEDVLVFEELQARMVQRIAECVGVVRHRNSFDKSEYTTCPALGGDVVSRLVRSVEETLGTNSNN